MEEHLSITRKCHMGKGGVKRGIVRVCRLPFPPLRVHRLKIQRKRERERQIESAVFHLLQSRGRGGHKPVRKKRKKNSSHAQGKEEMGERKWNGGLHGLPKQARSKCRAAKKNHGKKKRK